MSARYLFGKIVAAVGTIGLIIILNFVLFRMMPGSPDRILLHNTAITTDVRAAARERWGLDEPLGAQLVKYIGSTVQGDLGYSFQFAGQPVSDILAARVWPTLILFGLGQLIAIILGLTLGAFTGWRRGSIVDHAGNGLSIMVHAMPYFVIGMLIIGVFASGFGWFPSSGMLTPGATYASIWAQLGDFAWHLALPLAVVAIGLTGQYSILMRASVIDTLNEDYMTTARAKGLSAGRQLRAHALPNALLPVVTLGAVNLGYVIGGAIALEVVFNWPGLGSLTLAAVSARDYPVLQGIFLLLAISVVAANLVADIICGVLDPRLGA